MKKHLQLLLLLFFILFTFGVSSRAYADEFTDYDDEEIILSASQLEDKELLNENLDKVIEDISPDDYINDEVVVLADSKVEAEAIAKAYGSRLISYGYGVAVISVPEYTTAKDMIRTASLTTNRLPAVWPNIIYEIEDSEYCTFDPYVFDDSDYYQWTHDYIGDKYAWAQGCKGRGVKIAVIDTGINASHPDIDANLMQGLDFTTGSEKATNKDDDNGTHGSHVAGIIAAEDNGIWGSGIAPEATLQSLCVTDKAGKTNTALVKEAINYAVDEGFDLISTSIGGVSYDPLLESAIRESYENGILVFCSAGNNRTSTAHYPSDYYGAVSVASIDRSGAQAYFTNFGEKIDFAYPGVGIWSINSYYDGVSESDTYGPYLIKNGTSMSCPQATATAALILSSGKVGNKTGKAKSEAIIALMKKGAIKSASDGMGVGTPYIPSILGLNTKPDKPKFTVISGNEIEGSKNTYSNPEISVKITSNNVFNTSIYYSTNGKTPAYKDGQVINGIKYENYVNLSGAAQVTLKAIAVNELTSEVSKPVSLSYRLKPPVESLQVFTSAYISDNCIVKPSKNIQLRVNYFPEYCTPRKVKWELNDTAKAAGIKITSAGLVKISAKTKEAAEEMDYYAYAKALDIYGVENGITDRIKITVSADDPTKINKIKAVKGSVSISVNAIDYDASNNFMINGLPSASFDKPLIFSSYNTDIAYFSDKYSGKLTIKKPGKVKINAMAADGSNKSASFNLEIKRPVSLVRIDASDYEDKTGTTEIACGKSFALKSYAFPDDAGNKKLSWSIYKCISPDGTYDILTGANLEECNKYSDKTSRVSVNNGKVSVGKNAEACKYVVKAKALDGYGAYSFYEFSVCRDAVLSVSVDKSEITIFTVKSFVGTPVSDKIIATASGGNESLAFKSSNPSIVRVDAEGNVYSCGKPGKAVITAFATDGSGKKATTKVSVNIPMSFLYMTSQYNNSTTGTSLAQGGSMKMIVRCGVDYGKPTDKRIKFSVSDETIATVNEKGIVKVSETAKINSKVILTATALDGSGVYEKYTIYITPKYENLDYIAGTGSLAEYYVLSGEYIDGNGNKTKTNNPSLYSTYTVESEDSIGLQQSTVSGSTGYYRIVPKYVTAYSVVDGEYKSMKMAEWKAALNEINPDDTELIRAFLNNTSSKVYITGTINDGLFQKHTGIFYSVKSNEGKVKNILEKDGVFYNLY